MHFWRNAMCCKVSCTYYNIIVIVPRRPNVIYNLLIPPHIRAFYISLWSDTGLGRDRYRSLHAYTVRYCNTIHFIQQFQITFMYIFLHFRYLKTSFRKRRLKSLGSMLHKLPFRSKWNTDCLKGICKRHRSLFIYKTLITRHWNVTS